jgi:hypothetical protein
MRNAAVRLEADDTYAPGTPEAALRLMLEEARQQAAQSRLLALNMAIESAACNDAGETGQLAAGACDDAQRVADAVERLLLQIRHSRPL